MKYSTLLSNLKKQINFEPKQADLCKILNMSRATMSNRVKNDSNFDDEEIAKIEEQYGINLNSGLQVDCIELEHIHINPSCGIGTVVVDTADVTPIKIGKEIIKSVWNAKPENLKIFKASGDSMQETIIDNDLLLVDISKTDYNNGGIFLITINNDWFVKRLRLRITGELDIISDNKAYPIETLQPSANVEIKVIGRVIKNLSRGL